MKVSLEDAKRELKDALDKLTTKDEEVVYAYKQEFGISRQS